MFFAVEDVIQKGGGGWRVDDVALEKMTSEVPLRQTMTGSSGRRSGRILCECIFDSCSSHESSMHIQPSCSQTNSKLTD